MQAVNEAADCRVNYMLGDLFADRFALGSELERASFEAGWQAHRACVHPELGERAHRESRKHFGVSIKQLGDAWKLGFTARGAWIAGTFHKLMRNPAYRDETLRAALIATMQEVRPEGIRWMLVALAIERMGEKYPNASTRDVLAELIGLQVDGVIELRPERNLESFTLKERYLSPPGPDGTRYVYARFLTE